MTMSKRNILGVWVAVFAFIALVFGSFASFSEDQYAVPSTQFEQGVILPSGADGRLPVPIGLCYPMAKSVRRGGFCGPVAQLDRAAVS